MSKVAIFISGEGSNALKMLEDFDRSSMVKLAFIYSTKPNIRVEKACKEKAIKFHFRPWNVESHEVILENCKKKGIEWIVLAGFLKLIPASFIDAYPNKIVNIHPALLPSFGGKGMYGMHVHKAVIAASSRYSGISIHFVNGAYDEGQIIAQFKVELDIGETAETLKEKIRVLEHQYFSETVAHLIDKRD